MHDGVTEFKSWLLIVLILKNYLFKNLINPFYTLFRLDLFLNAVRTLYLQVNIDLFSKLKQLWAERNRVVSEFWVHDKDVDFDLDIILEEVQHFISFKGKKELLLKRIRKVASIKEFSFREMKLLRLLVKIQLESGNIYYNQLEYFKIAISKYPPCNLS